MTHQDWPHPPPLLQPPDDQANIRTNPADPPLNNFKRTFQSFNQTLPIPGIMHSTLETSPSSPHTSVSHTITHQLQQSSIDRRDEEHDAHPPSKRSKLNDDHNHHSSHPSPSQEPQQDNGNDTSSTSTSETSPSAPSDPPLVPHPQITTNYFNQVIVSGVVNKTTTRENLVPLITDILGDIGTITATEIAYFMMGKKATEVIMTVTFQEASSARAAFYKRRLGVPPPFCHKGTRLTVYAKFPDPANLASLATPESSCENSVAAEINHAKPPSLNSPPHDSNPSGSHPQPSNESDDKTRSAQKIGERSAETGDVAAHNSGHQNEGSINGKDSSRSSGSHAPPDNEHAQDESPPSDEAEKLNSPPLLTSHDQTQGKSPPPPAKQADPMSSVEPSSPSNSHRSKMSDRLSSRSCQVVALAIVHHSLTRDHTIKMAHRVLEPLGRISDVEILFFEGHRCLKVALLITFTRSSAARKACSIRRFRVPSAYHYRDHDLVAFEYNQSPRQKYQVPSDPQLGPSQPLESHSSRNHLSDETSQQPIPSVQPDATCECSDMDLADPLQSSPHLKPLDTFSCDPPAKSPDIEEIDQLNSSPDLKPVDMLSCDPLDDIPLPAPSSPHPQSSQHPSHPEQAIAQEEAPAQGPSSKKLNICRIVSDKSPPEPESVPSEQPQESLSLNLRTESKSSSPRPISASRLELTLPKKSHQPSPVYQVFASGAVRSSCTREKIPQLISDTLGYLGAISEVEIMSFVREKKFIEIVLAISFEQSSAAREALFHRTFEVPARFSYPKASLTIHRTLPGTRNQDPPLHQSVSRPDRPSPESPRGSVSQSKKPAQSPCESDSPRKGHPHAMHDSSQNESVVIVEDEELSMVPASSSQRLAEASVKQPPCGSRRESAMILDEQADQTEDSASEDVPLWDRVSKMSHPANHETSQRPTSPLVVLKSPVQPSPPPRHKNRSTAVWIKASFPPQIKKPAVEAFIRQTFEPLGKITSLRIHRRQKGLIDLRVTVDKLVAKQAAKLIHGQPFRECNNWPLHLSTHYIPGVRVLKALRAKVQEEALNARPLSPESPKCRDIELDSAPGSPQLPPSSPLNETQDDQPVLPEDIDLPLQVVRFPIPENCQSDHPSCSLNRLHYKLEKIRSIKNQTVIDSSWDRKHLTLHVVPNSKESSSEAPAVDESHPVASTSASVSRDSSRSSERSVTPPIDIQQRSYPKIHRSWPFEPLPMSLDENAVADLPRTLNDFLTTFFRLWEASRKDLRNLYDDSAVFSNVLAKQGRRASAITKSTGWENILTSISRLPALSNDPITDLIIDACPISHHPLRIMCNIHGSFSEFPKNIRRAFDRSLILRPVDVYLNPSEGCLGFLKWIILSDTLTIRKHTSRTVAITEAFRDSRQSDACKELVSDYHPAQQVLQENAKSRREPSAETRGRSTSHHRPVQSSHGSPCPGASRRTAEPSNDHNHATSSAADYPQESHRSLRSGSETGSQSTSEYARLQSQLKAMQAEIENLKTLTRSADQQPAGRTTRVVKQDVNTGEKSHPTGFAVVNPRNFSHMGFGVAKKRLLLHTNLDRYLAVSMRGDILTWDPTNSPHVELVRSGASPTDIVDSACYSPRSLTLIVGSRTSTSAKNTHNSNVNLVKIHNSKKGVMTFDRLLLDDPIHENGVRATCLAPSRISMEANQHTTEDSRAAGGCTAGQARALTSFLTAGQDRFLALWKVDHSLSKKRHVVHRKDVVKIPVSHSGPIQSLCLLEHRNWVLSGSHDGKVLATDLSQAFNHTLCLEENTRIFDIQANPIARDNIMVTTANKAPGSQFRYCDLRTAARPVISFGMSSSSLGTTTTGTAEPLVKCHRKGSLRDYLFSYPHSDPDGSVLLWDMRFISSASSSSASYPGRRDSCLLGSLSGGTAIQTYFDGPSSLVVLQKEVITTLNIVEEFT